MVKAKEWDVKRDHAAANPHFEYAEAAFRSHRARLGGDRRRLSALLGVSGVLAVMGVLLTLNGYLLLVPPPRVSRREPHTRASRRPDGHRGARVSSAFCLFAFTLACSTVVGATAATQDRE
jgi:hypothetical protein